MDRCPTAGPSSPSCFWLLTSVRVRTYGFQIHVCTYLYYTYVYMYYICIYRERERDRRTDRQTGRQAGRQTERQRETYITLHYITLHYITLQYSTVQYSTVQYSTVQYSTVHYITLHDITLHYITLHYIRTEINTHAHRESVRGSASGWVFGIIISFFIAMVIMPRERDRGGRSMRRRAQGAET